MVPYTWLDNLNDWVLLKLHQVVLFLKLGFGVLWGICILIGPFLIVVGAVGGIVYLFAIAQYWPAMIGVLAFSIFFLASALIKRWK